MSGNLKRSPADVIRELVIDLADGTEPDDDLAWPVFCESMPDAPDNAICVYNAEGIQHGSLMVGGTVAEHYGIQVMVRSNDIGDAYIRSKQIFRNFDTGVNRTNVIVSTDTYRVDNIGRVGLPTKAGVDGRRFLYSFNSLAAIVMSDVGTGA